MNKKKVYATRKCLRTMKGHSSSVPSVVFSPDGKYIASRSADDTIKIWGNPDDR
ncbi:MAG: hypothetical protein K8T10_17225 [Candidatus Eremiobacteraeota bacterium]|nr:hypothetical protein [Candidatus Eremiobacteraeota bacterium]